MKPSAHQRENQNEEPKILPEEFVLSRSEQGEQKGNHKRTNMGQGIKNEGGWMQPARLLAERLAGGIRCERRPGLGCGRVWFGRLLRSDSRVRTFFRRHPGLPDRR